jgi:putative hydrolase of the HAD superfamily
MNITHIYFDWAKTLAIPKTRDIFISTSTLSVLYPDVLKTLTDLHKKGYTLGIISNTHKKPDDFIQALSKSGLIHLFNGTIALSSEPKLCPKACKEIFNYCLLQDNVLPQHAVMVGDNYQTDIIGALSVGMNAIHVNRDKNQTRQVYATSNYNTNVHVIQNIGDLLHYFY